MQTYHDGPSSKIPTIYPIIYVSSRVALLLGAKRRSACAVRQQWTWVSAFSSSWVRSTLLGYPQSAVTHGLVGEWEARARTRQEGMEVIHHIIYLRFSTFLDQPKFTEN
jgi:hypothetical protein